MKAAVISLGSVSSKLTIEAMRKYFDSVDDLDIRKIEVDVTGNDTIYYEGNKMGNYDCVYVKGSFRFASLQRAVTSILENRKTIYLPISPQAFTNGHDKLLTHLMLQRKNIPMPPTYLSATPKASKEILKKMNYPIILKIPHGTQGKGVMFAESFAAASSMLDTLTALKQPFIIQEYIETGGSDLRIIVVGDHVVAAYKRRAQNEEKRANIHAGGIGEPTTLEPRTKKLAVDTAKAMEADICAIDILQGAKGPLVIEINLSPGLQGIMKATKIDVPDKIAKFLFEKTQIFKNKTQKSSKVLSDLGIDLQTDKKKIQSIITNLDMRGVRILLPELVSRLSKIDEKTEVEIKVSPGEIIIKEV